MSNWRSKIKRLFKALWTLLTGLLKKLSSQQSSQKRLESTCEALQQQLTTAQDRDKIWQTYTKALSLARQSDRQELAQVILTFDPRLGDRIANVGLVVGQALSDLIEAKPQTTKCLDAAWRLSQRLEKLKSRRETQQQICIQGAQLGDNNFLLARLFQRRNEGSLTTAELTQVFHRFLERHSLTLSNSRQPRTYQRLPSTIGCISPCH